MANTLAAWAKTLGGDYRHHEVMEMAEAAFLTQPEATTEGVFLRDRSAPPPIGAAVARRLHMR